MTGFLFDYIKNQCRVFFIFSIYSYSSFLHSPPIVFLCDLWNDCFAVIFAGGGEHHQYDTTATTLTYHPYIHSLMEKNWFSVIELNTSASVMSKYTIKEMYFLKKDEFQAYVLEHPLNPLTSICIFNNSQLHTYTNSEIDNQIKSMNKNIQFITLNEDYVYNNIHLNPILTTNYNSAIMDIGAGGGGRANRETDEHTNAVRGGGSGSGSPRSRSCSSAITNGKPSNITNITINTITTATTDPDGNITYSIRSPRSCCSSPTASTLRNRKLLSSSSSTDADTTLMSPRHRHKRIPSYPPSSARIFQYNFILIEYRHPRMKTATLVLEFPLKNTICVYSQIFSICHIGYLLKQQHSSQAYLFDKDYILHIIDFNVETIELNSTQYIQFNTETSYTVCNGIHQAHAH